MSADLALELEDVVFRYQEKGRRNILDHTSLTNPAGTLTVLLGGSACGKRTLAAMAAGDKSHLSSALRSAYRGAGLSHVLVVCGLHVTSG